ncbi:MAG: ABC transporter permease [Nitrospinae bacterium]|nr:ABC transporter permease [Nitrospinota bacterium]
MNTSVESQTHVEADWKASSLAERAVKFTLESAAYFRDLGFVFLEFCVGVVRLKENQWRYTKGLITHQIIFSGIDAIYVVSVISMLVGGVVMVQLLSFSPGFQTDAFLMKVMVGLVIKEIAPIFCSLILVGRSGSAIAVELGEMKVKRHHEALEAMGISMFHYFNIPRIIGLAVANAMLVGYFVVMTLFSWLLISSFHQNIHLAGLLDLLAGSLSLGDVALSAAKGGLMGVIIAVVCVYHGGKVESSATEIPQRTSRAIVDSFLYCFIFDAAVSVGFYVV